MVYSDEDWARVSAKREAYITEALEKLERVRGVSRPICGWPRPPDHADRSLSKRMWENRVMHFRWRLEELTKSQSQ